MKQNFLHFLTVTADGRPNAAFLAALPHLVFAIFFALPGIAGGGLGILLLVMMAAAFLLAWWQGWPLWSGSWAGYWLVYALIQASSWLPSLPGLELLIPLAVGIFIFQRRPLLGLLASTPPLLLLPRFFVFELVTGGEWVWSAIYLLLALTAGTIVWRNSLRAGTLLMIGFHLIAGLAIALARSYLPFRFIELGPRQTSELATLINDFVPLTLAVITILLALLLLQPLGRLAARARRQGRSRQALLLLGMALTLGGVFALRTQPHLTNAASPAAAATIASLAIVTGLVLSLSAAMLLTRVVWPDARPRFPDLLLPLLAALAPLVVFALAPPVAPVGRYSDRFQTVLFLSYGGVILWALAALWVIALNDKVGSSRLSGPETGDKDALGRAMHRRGFDTR